MRAISQPAEARKSRRYSCHGPISFRVHCWETKGKIINLCLEGCLIRPAQQLNLTVGDTFDLRFRVNRLSLQARCIVRRLGPDNTLGVEILMISKRCRRLLLDLLDELAATR